MAHPHLCPVCKKAFMCVGTKCASYNGVPHKACAPTNKTAKWTIEVKPCELGHLK